MHLQETFGVQIKSAVFSFSLLLSVVCLGQSLTDVAPEVRSAKTAGQAARILEDVESVGKDDSLKALVERAQKYPDNKSIHNDIVDAVNLRVLIEIAPAHDAAAPSIKRIQSNPLYRNVDERRSSNWIGDTLDKVRKLFPKLKQPKVDTPNMPQISGLDVAFRAIAWLLLGGLLVTFLVFALRYWSFRQNLKRRASAVLEDDEPERTLDEWLALANQLESEGKYREAIRCLYLACLLKFDEAGVARFVRSHTNWEHLERIQSSPKNPGIDFLPLTRAFDLAWYGYRVRGPEDVSGFRMEYEHLRQVFGGRP